MRKVKYALFVMLMLACATLSATTVRQVGMIDIPGNPGFDDLAFAKGMLVMTHAGAGTVDIFDPAKRRLIAHITNMAQPRAIAVSEATGKIYIGNTGNNTIVILSTGGWKVEDVVPISGSPDSLLLTPGGKTLLVLHGAAESVGAIDLAQKREVKTVKLDGRPEYMASDPGRELTYVTVQDSKSVVALDPQLRIVKRYALLASQPTGIAYDSKLDRIYVSVRYAVLALNADTGKEVARVAAPAGVDQLWFDEPSKTLFAASGRAILVMRADGRLVASDEVPTDVRGHTLAFDAERNLIYMPGGREGRSKLLILRHINSNIVPDSLNALRKSKEQAEAQLR